MNTIFKIHSNIFKKQYSTASPVCSSLHIQKKINTWPVWEERIECLLFAYANWYEEKKNPAAIAEKTDGAGSDSKF